MKRTKKEVEAIISTINEAIPQKSDTNKRQIHGDYCPQFGGWLLTYYDEACKAHTISYTRMTHSEAHRFLEGMLYSINAF